VPFPRFQFSLFTSSQTGFAPGSGAPCGGPHPAGTPLQLGARARQDIGPPSPLPLSAVTFLTMVRQALAAGLQEHRDTKKTLSYHRNIKCSYQFALTHHRVQCSVFFYFSVPFDFDVYQTNSIPCSKCSAARLCSNPEARMLLYCPDFGDDFFPGKANKI